MSEIRKFPVASIFEQSWAYIKENIGSMSAFMLVNFAFLILGFDIIGGMSSPVFLVWAVVYYMFWTYFFRFYFSRKPYLILDRTVVDSLVPSTKLLVIGFIVMTILVVLPFVPLFMLPLESAERYENFLRKYMQDSKALDFILTFFIVLFSPIIFYRPFMAWISSVIGRSGAIKTAWAKTEGNHWRMVLVVLIMNIPFSLMHQVDFIYSVPNIVSWFVVSPFVIYFNVVLAKSYEFFYME